MNSGSSARRGRPPKGSPLLSKPAIVQATLQVIDAEGAAGVSMRAVARVLGVDPKSLYNHVNGKDGLLDAVAEGLLGALDLPDPIDDLAADLTAIAYAFRDRALAQPDAAALALTRPMSSLEGLAPVEAVLSVLRTAGFDAQVSVHLLRCVLATLIGTLLREVNAGPTFGSDDVAGRTAVLEASGLPAVAGAAPYLAMFDAQREFDYVVELCIDAVLRRVPSAADASDGD
ncbi:TetR/AcrR family transcriptional regulator C-terminal domain-containing protein [Gordonia sp. HY442]|uniref:TetR/AcrR family transcriptional regulator n=1 Tax=Gordonia zhenghanii TaxID=2911516 RepID=UPI001EFFA508|nr:TetR/AcrR family transcriptional regulator C-terminal domain-containing protein [Gordonia zhenghanii]MCF8604004.1 TetR/AcrR family transcriptional regulator C-terminal domain-containing protein [Gordonia zhenghanii]